MPKSKVKTTSLNFFAFIFTHECEKQKQTNKILYFSIILVILCFPLICKQNPGPLAEPQFFSGLDLLEWVAMPFSRGSS